MEPNKMEMARIIAQALFNLKTMPHRSHWKVKDLMQLKRENLSDNYKLALKVLDINSRY